MDDTERRTAKRSRFDQTEPEPKRASRFDRRSKSPPAGKPSTAFRRSRSPLPARSSRSSQTPPRDHAKTSGAMDPAAAAAAAAARINAQINAKKLTDHADITPNPSQSPGPRSPAVATGVATGTVGTVNGDMYIADGDYIRDIEVNDLRNRYTLTKGSTQKMIKDETGADVTTRGSYFPDKTLATAANPPLYLHVTSTSKAGLEKAVEKINELMQQELPNLVDERRFRRREPEQFERDEFGRRKWPEEKIEIPFESAPGFNLRAQVVGHGGAYVKYIQQETRCRVQIKGRGSGFMEHGTGIESEEDMYLHVAGPDPVEVQKAKTLCLELLENVKQQYEEFKLRPQPQRSYGGEGRGGYGGEGRGGYGGEGRGGYGGGHNGYGGDRHQDRSNPYSSGGPSAGGYGGYGNSPAPPASGSSLMSPPSQASAGSDPNAAYAAQYAQYYAQSGGDPYAAYGGYEAYVQYYQQWYASQGAQQQPQGPPGAPAPASVPPPPPPSEGPPGSTQAPPPPPTNPPPGNYNAVPPPPGL